MGHANHDTDRHDRSVASLSTSAATQLSDIATLQGLSFEDPLAILGTAPHPFEPWWKRISPSTALVLLAGAIGIFFMLHELVIGGGLGLPTDESWIEQVYARNFFRHVSFEFNPGEITAGPTAPLWVVALSVGTGLFHDPMISAKLLGSVFLFLTGFYVFRLLRTSETDYGTALLAAVLTMSTQHLAWSQLSGLESSLSAVLVIAGLWWYFQSRDALRRSLTGAIFALAALARPETCIIFGILLLWTILHSDHSDGSRNEHRMRDPLLMLMLFLIILIPIGITNVAISGSVVPVTFFAGLARDSLPMLLRHGKVPELGVRLIYSLGSLVSMSWLVYLPAHPLFFATIPTALLLRKRSPIARTASHQLLSLCAILLVTFPYIRAVVLGINDTFGDNERLVHFVEPLYIVAGILSLKELVQRLTLRALSPRQTLYAGAAALTVAGIVYLSLRPQLAVSFQNIGANIDFILLLFFLGVLLSVALAYCGLHPFKPEIPQFVTEEERSRYTYRTHEETEGDRALPEVVKNVLRGCVLLTLAWNLTELPRAANEYGENVRTMRGHLAFARAVSDATTPSDLIAADQIGVLGWASGRRIYDLQGRLANEPKYNRRALGRERGTIETLKQVRPSFVAIFSPEYCDVARNDSIVEAFDRVLSIRQPEAPALYKFSVSRLK